MLAKRVIILCQPILMSRKAEKDFLSGPTPWKMKARLRSTGPCYFILKISCVFGVMCWLISNVDSRHTPCTIRCGVVDASRESGHLYEYVSSKWSHIRRNRSLNSIEMQFMPITAPDAVEHGAITNTYMEIGTRSISALIGDFSLAVAIASLKKAIPYFTISGDINKDHVPANVLSARPNSLDIYHITGDLVRKYSWTNVAVFYDDSAGTQLIEELVANPDVHVRAMKIEPSTDRGTIREFLLHLRQLAVTEMIVMASWSATDTLLATALNLSMLSNRHSWIIASLNPNELSLLNYSFTQVNLTTFQMAGTRDVTDRRFSSYDYAAVYDSLLALYNAALMQWHREGNCNWTSQGRFKEGLSAISVPGANGDLRFDEQGHRTGYVVKVLSLTMEEKLKQIGQWNSSVSDPETRLIIISDNSRAATKSLYPLGKHTIKVAITLEEPFVMLKNGYKSRRGNDRYEGFCVDILENLGKRLQFNYDLYEVQDKEFGQELANGTWTGLVGDIVAGKADLAMSSLTITSHREKVIDFTIPFKTRSISIIMRKPPPDSTFFQFAAPLSGFVWLLLGAVLVFVSLTLYVVDRLAPQNDSKVGFEGAECVWFVFASMVLSGTSVTPKTISGRFLAAALSFFSLIIFSSYTANLAAFLTVSKFHSDINTVADLLNQHDIDYGTVRGSEVSEYFDNSDLQLFKDMWHTMQTLNPGSMVDTAEDGFQRLKNASVRQYAFLYDAPVIRHRVNFDCELMEVGEPFDARGYGIGVPMRASYRDVLTLEILKMGDEGILPFLERKWWNATKCPNLHRAVPNERASLTLHKVGGVFVVLAGCIIVALIVCIVEQTCNRFQNRKGSNKNRRVCETNSVEQKGEMSSVVDTPRLQAEEPFLKNQTHHISKQTNIF